MIRIKKKVLLGYCLSVLGDAQFLSQPVNKNLDFKLHELKCKQLLFSSVTCKRIK